MIAGVRPSLSPQLRMPRTVLIRMRVVRAGYLGGSCVAARPFLDNSQLLRSIGGAALNRKESSLSCLTINFDCNWCVNLKHDRART